MVRYRRQDHAGPAWPSRRLKGSNCQRTHLQCGTGTRCCRVATAIQNARPGAVWRQAGRIEKIATRPRWVPVPYSKPPLAPPYPIVLRSLALGTIPIFILFATPCGCGTCAVPWGVKPFPLFSHLLGDRRRGEGSGFPSRATMGTWCPGRGAGFILHLSTFILHPSSFILPLCPFRLRTSLSPFLPCFFFPLPPSPFLLPPSHLHVPEDSR